ncbi:unannotated protein [freshwater metagenome]|uniref:Unannotated protein n=1 Tax=freshwater metagenome TaxID=449393 RepID=A0A6J7NQF7_9ZZZZ
MADEHGYVAMGGSAEAISAALADSWRAGLTLAQAVRLAVDLLEKFGSEEVRALTAAQLEVAVLDRNRPRRTFNRISVNKMSELLG